MPIFERDGIKLAFEEVGQGFPVLTFAPGGMRSSAERWASAPWDPRKELSSEFRVITMDQRNAGASSAPVRASDGWQSYAADHVALLDHLGVGRCHVLGGCIGGAFCLSLMQAAPGRVTSAVLQQPIGLSPDNRQAFYELFDGWATELQERDGESDDAAIGSFREHMYGGDFVFSVTREFVQSCNVPMLVLMGNDSYHPEPISREIARLAPNAVLIERWKEPENVAETVRRVREFFVAHTP